MKTFNFMNYQLNFIRIKRIKQLLYLIVLSLIFFPSCEDGYNLSLADYNGSDTLTVLIGHNELTVKDFGAKGDGVTNDSGAIEAMDDSLGYVRFNGGTYLITGTLSLNGDIRGYGKIKSNDAFSSYNQPTCKIEVFGNLSGNIIYWSGAISEGDETFSASNSFQAGDLVVLRNEPTSNFDRRKEVAKISYASAASFTIEGGATYDYSDNSITFEKVNTKEFILSDEIELSGIYINVKYCDGVIFRPKRITKCMFVSETSYNHDLDVRNFDASYTNCRVVLAEASRFGHISIVGGGKDAGDVHGDLKLNTGIHDIICDVVSLGNTPSQSGSNYSSVALHVDPTFTGNPTGYYYLPCSNIQGRVNSKGNTIALFLAGNSDYGDYGVKNSSFTITGYDGSSLQYVHNCVVDASGVTRPGGETELSFAGSSNIKCYSNNIPYITTDGGGHLVSKIKWNGLLDVDVRAFGADTAGTANYSGEWGRTNVIDGIAYTDVRLNWTSHTGSGQLRIGLKDGLVANTSANVTATILDTNISSAARITFLQTSNQEDIYIIKDTSGNPINVVGSGFITLRVTRKIGAFGI